MPGRLSRLADPRRADRAAELRLDCTMEVVWIVLAVTAVVHDMMGHAGRINSGSALHARGLVRAMPYHDPGHAFVDGRDSAPGFSSLISR